MDLESGTDDFSRGRSYVRDTGTGRCFRETVNIGWKDLVDSLKYWPEYLSYRLSNILPNSSDNTLEEFDPHYAVIVRTRCPQLFLSTKTDVCVCA